MEEIKQQVLSVSKKVDLISETLEDLNRKIIGLLSERSWKNSPDLSPPQTHSPVSHCPLPNRPEMMMEHKDILLDEIYIERDNNTKERQLSPELQVQRLTAQLTAAYNRIAALEEQLLAQRIH